MKKKKHAHRRPNPNAPTGRPTPGDAAHTAYCEAARARRDAEAAERRRVSPDEWVREVAPRRRTTPALLLLGALLAGVTVGPNAEPTR